MIRRKLTDTLFAYWLQGAFEIGEWDCLDDERVRMIHHRINDIENPGRLAVTCRMMLWTCSKEDALRGMRDLLSDIFIHDIDPSYDGDQELFHRIHRGEQQNA